MRSLRGRLTIGVVAVLAAILAIAGTVTSRYVDRSERDALDDRLRRTAELSRATAVAAVAEGLPENDRRLDAVLSATDTSLRLVLGRATLLETGEDRLRPPDPPRPGLRTFTLRGQQYRTYAVSLRDPNLGGLALLEVTTSLRSLQERQSALDRRLLVLGLVALIAAGAGTWLAAELVLRPLRRLRAVTASVVDDEDLDRRVPSDDGPAELRALAASFNAMLSRLQGSAAARERALAGTRRFAADAGHELRTPLTSVQAVLDAVRRHPELPAAQREAMLADADAQQQRLVALLDGLQALARGDAAPPRHVPVDLAELVRDAVDDARARHPDIALRTSVPREPLAIAGWEPGLRSLVDNLVENAIRHGRPNGVVEVDLSRGASGVVLTVSDDGPGVPPEDRERIFEPFAHASNARAPGSGLGLALVAQQARQHDATVTVGDADGGGARFEVRFPLERELELRLREDGRCLR